MYTVYGIYKIEECAPVYVGLTSHPLGDRFYNHLLKGLEFYLRPTEKTSPTQRLYGYWMFMHVAGVHVLEMLPIAVVEDYWEALRAERGLIYAHQPILNTQSKAISKSAAYNAYLKARRDRRDEERNRSVREQRLHKAA